MKALRSQKTIIPVVVFALLALMPLAGLFIRDGFLLSLFSRVMIFAIAATALDLILGFGAMVSFGHAAFIGIGAYAMGILASHGFDGVLPGLLAALLASAVFALVTGAISLRTKGVYFIMITLAFGQMAFYTAASLRAYGGDDGLTVASRSLVMGQKLLKDDRVFYYVILACLIGVYLLCRAVVASRFGRVLQGAKQNSQRMQAIGFNPYPYQLAAYVIAGMIGGLSGFLLANLTEFVSPAYMSWQRSGELIIMVVLGGMGTLHGAVIGAAAFILMEEWLSGFTEHWKVIFGPLLVLVVLFMRGGLLGALQRLTGGGAMAEPVLSLHGLCKNFGGLRVTDNVTLDVRPGEIHAIIGPNGAGKTTLIHQISGFLQPDAGQVRLAGRDVTRLAPHDRARAGLARSFQITSILPSFSALENVALAVQARSGSSFRFFGKAAQEGALNEEATAMLAEVGLADRTGISAGVLSHGEKRALECAIALAMQPRVMLLDEPMAGAGHDEGQRLIDLMMRLKSRIPMLLVEHDMDAVFRVADRVSVLVYGQIIASGTPSEIRANAEVRTAYLGEETGAAH